MTLKKVALFDEWTIANDLLKKITSTLCLIVQRREA